ncbi:MAG: GGDEF domain-containing protein, partial [Proteobacteria bacterium]|nr:GGDEF domain-containing protein [Pseudomonadota bacterium]
QLEVSTNTLMIAFNYLSGAEPELVRLIDRRMTERLPVTLDWLDRNVAESGLGNEVAIIAKMMERLETSIEEFGRTSRDAHRATSEYNSALEAHLGELEQVTTAGVVIGELATIAKVMLKRTREIEKQMARSDAQTRALRKRLAEARRSADEDHLTGLPNRRAFEARYEEEYRQAFAALEPMTIAFCDIDNFKRINDGHGHEAGDRVLKLVADSLARTSDDRCHVARHGGEEFVLLFRNTPIDAAFTRLEALRQQLAERSLVNRATDLPFGQITFSAGMADVFAYSDRRSALKAADAALYRAKQEGRNRIVVAGPAETGPIQLAPA